MLVSAKEMLTKAREGHYAVGQFNINNLEWTKAVLYSTGIKFPGDFRCFRRCRQIHDRFKTVVGMVNGMLEELNITVPVALHLDHGTFEGCSKCIEAGFSSSCLMVPTIRLKKISKRQRTCSCLRRKRYVS